MRETHLLGQDWGGEARFQRVRDTLLVVSKKVDEHKPKDGHERIMVTFDLRDRRPLGPARPFTSPVHLCELPMFGPEPVLASMTPDSLIITDVRDGSVLKTFPVTGARRTGPYDHEYDLALGRYGDQDLLFLHEKDEGFYGQVWWAMDLATGAPVPGTYCTHFCYTETSGRLTLRHGYLAHPTTDEVVEFSDDDFSVFNGHFICVHRAEDGTYLGKVPIKDWVPEDRAVDIAHAAGRTYLAEAGALFTLPDLKPALPHQQEWAAVSRVTEWGGRPVTVLYEENRFDQPWNRLSYLFLDVEAPEKFPIPWTAAHLPETSRLFPQVHDLLVTPEGTIMLSTDKGVHMIDLDPEEAARADHPDQDT